MRKLHFTGIDNFPRSAVPEFRLTFNGQTDWLDRQKSFPPWFEYRGHSTISEHQTEPREKGSTFYLDHRT